MEVERVFTAYRRTGICLLVVLLLDACGGTGTSNPPPSF